MQLASTLEGMMSADDRPQSAKEVLELSREELLEINDKLAALNAELQGTVEELNRANNELKDDLKESEHRFRLKLESILAPEGSIGNLELGDIIDARTLQSLADDFHELTRMPMSLTDVNGKVLVGVGWQEICTEFHRINPDTCRNCIESDVHLSAGVPIGEYKIYKCRNNMWDVATPVMLGDKRLGNLFMGQFFFEDEPLDFELFRAQAREYRFDETKYIAALEAVPRLSRKGLNTSMTFFMKLAGILSKLSFSNLNLARSLSERENLMLSLHQSEQQLRLFIEHAPAALAMFDADMRYLCVSRRWLSDFGLCERDLTGESHYDVFPEITAAWREAHRRGLAGEVLRNEGDRFERADGTLQWKRWEIRPWYHEEGKIGGIVIFAEDITERKRAEEELQESMRREQERTAELATLLNAVPTPVFIAHDTECLSITGNRAADELLYIPYGTEASLSAPDEVRPRLFRALKDGQELRLDELPAQRAARGTHVEDFEFSIAFDDDSTRHVLGYGTPLKDKDGRPRGAVHVLVDITERKRAEEELLNKNQKLEAMAIELSLAEERERDRIAGELHDQVGQRLILGKMRLGALASQVQADECINEIEELDRIIDLSIEDIRTLTFQLRPPILASAGLEAALHWLGEEFHEKYGLLPNYSDDGQQKPMRYEARSTVFQAAREMLLNTVKHADATHIGINIRREADMLQLCLSDNGRGFDLDEARIKKSKSGGFGLINVQRRIEHLGGRVIIESRPGNGTRVTIMAPLDITQ